MSASRSVPFITLEGAKVLAAAAEAEALKRGLDRGDRGGRSHRWPRPPARARRNPAGEPGHRHREGADGGALQAADEGDGGWRRGAAALSLLSVSRFALMLEGGVPITRDGAIIGAIGISGMTSAQDGEVAAAALAAFG